MSNAKKVAQPTQTKKASATTTQKSTLKKFNLESLNSKIENAKASEVVKNNREKIYKYPSEYSDFDINNQKGKSFRQARRKELQKYCNNIIVCAKHLQVKQNEESEAALSAAIADFKKWYETYCTVNDFSLSSFTSQKREKCEDFILMLDIIKAEN